MKSRVYAVMLFVLVVFNPVRADVLETGNDKTRKIIEIDFTKTIYKEWRRLRNGGLARNVIMGNRAFQTNGIGLSIDLVFPYRERFYDIVIWRKNPAKKDLIFIESIILTVSNIDPSGKIDTILRDNQGREYIIPGGKLKAKGVQTFTNKLDMKIDGFVFRGFRIHASARKEKVSTVIKSLKLQGQYRR